MCKYKTYKALNTKPKMTLFHLTVASKWEKAFLNVPKNMEIIIILNKGTPLNFLAPLLGDDFSSEEYAL